MSGHASVQVGSATATGTMEFTSVPGSGVSDANPIAGGNPGGNPGSSNPSAAAGGNPTVRTLHTAEMYPYGPPASINPFDDLGDVSDDDDVIAELEAREKEALRTDESMREEDAEVLDSEADFDVSDEDMPPPPPPEGNFPTQVLGTMEVDDAMTPGAVTPD
eukprot:4454936-Amphidinium_carterae.1